MSPTDPVADAKATLRAELVGRRRLLEPEDLRAAAVGLADQVLAMPAVRSASCIAAYVSVGHEPGTDVLVETLWRRGVRVLLPVTLPDLDLDWAAYAGPDDLVAGRRGLREPSGPRLGLGAVTAADVVLVPATAVDRDGHRLGQGGGCYDRVLPRLAPSTPVVALVHEGEVVDHVPHAAHDRPVGVVVTPERAVHTGLTGPG